VLLLGVYRLDHDILAIDHGGRVADSDTEQRGRDVIRQAVAKSSGVIFCFIASPTRAAHAFLPKLGVDPTVGETALTVMPWLSPVECKHWSRRSQALLAQ